VFLGILITWCDGLVIGYNGGHDHQHSYTDYGALDDYHESHAVLPTVGVPIHAVSAAPLHHHVLPNPHDVHDLKLHYGHHHREHDHEHDHDYYVSSIMDLTFILLPDAKEILGTWA
jgi:hypothetical protein